MKRFFVTSTNTDVGKTFISSILFNSLKNPCYFKPVQTGCVYEEDRVLVPDLDFIKDNSSIESMENFKCSYKLKYPLSPHLSCKKMETKISLDKIIDDFSKISKEFENIIVEGAGGVFTPLNEDGDYMYTLMKKLNIPSIVVTSTKVGTINDTILTINHLRQNNITISGIVFNNFTNLEHEIDNINFIKSYSKIENTLTIYNQSKFKILDQTLIDNFIKNI